MSETTEDLASRPGAGGTNFKQRIARDGKQKIESGKRAAADQIDEIADAIDLAGSQLDGSQPTLANYAAKLAEGVGGLATRLREDSLEDLYHEVRRLAARHPAMFVMGSAAIGLAIARFMRAEDGAHSSSSSHWSDDSADFNSRPRESSDTPTAGV
ncbi:hypothetical protein ACFPN2_26105 [Steroidobacter flavus]|uniref:DUF883 domain-containing protein n=1 Tax=Steroidobacter flavus TaxID=1842136 RepID=A0ABV8T1L6_9GAMM